MKSRKNTWKRTAAFVCAAAVCFGAVSPMGEKLTDVLSVHAEETLLTRDVLCGSQSDVQYWQSEHFQFIWGSSGADSARVTAEFLEGNARNLEACYDVYMNDLGMEPPTQSTNLSMRDGKEYKVNIYISGTGLAGFTDDWAYMAYDAGGFAYMFCCVDSMQYEPPSWVLPHEFGHVVTAHQLGWNENKFTYAWYESVGNWFREQYLYSDYYAPYVNSPGEGTDYFETYMKNLCFTAPLGRDYYAAWAFLQYLTENPDHLEGYGSDFVKTMMQQGQRDEYPLKMVDRLAAADMKETLGNYAKRLATLDFAQQERYQARQQQLFQNGEWNWGEIYTLLEKNGDNYYTVPTERAPQAAGVNLIPLEVTGDSISVTLEGLTTAHKADWRACIAVKQADGNTRYSEVFKPGERVSMEYDPASDLQAYLTVTATPDMDAYVECGLPYGEGSEFAEENYPFMEKPRYPYAVIMEGAGIRQHSNGTGIGHYHVNGGGFVAETATVADSVYVGPDAMVTGWANVSGNAVIKDYAVVTGSASVSGNAVIGGHAVIAENAAVKDNAIVGDYAGVMGNAVISENGRVLESGLVYNDYQVSGNATVKGVAFCMAKGALGGQAIADGDYYDDGNKTVQQGTVYGWVSSQSYADSRPFTDGLYGGYEFSEDSSEIAQDTYTSTYAVMQNAPLWENTRTSASGVMTFDGISQYMIMDSSLANFHDVDIQTSVLWRGSGDERIFSFGDGERYMYLSTNSGKPEFVIQNGSGEQKLTADTALVPGEWTKISVILTGDAGKIVINGQTAAEGSITADPVEVVSENARYYVGRGYEDGYFNGSMDFFRVNFKETAEPSEIYTETETIQIPDITGLVGDVNDDGKINILDLVLLKRIVTGAQISHMEPASDCDGSGVTGVSDVAALQKYLLGQGSEYIGKSFQAAAN